MSRIFFCLIFAFSSVSGLSLAEPTKEKEGLAGTWRHKEGSQIATYTFRPDGSFSAELKDGDNVRAMEGRWSVEEDMIVYSFISDSLDRIAPGVVDRDKLVRHDENSYTIVAGDGMQRTYWRVKDEEQKPKD